MFLLRKLWRAFNWFLDICEPYSDMLDEEVLFHYELLRNEAILFYDHIVMLPEIGAFLCQRDLKIAPIERLFSAYDMSFAHKAIQDRWYGNTRHEEYADFFFFFSYRDEYHLYNKMCENYHCMMARDESILEWCFPRTDLMLYLIPSKVRNYIRNGYISSDSWDPQTVHERNVWKYEHYDFAPAEPTVVLKYEDLSLYLKRICYQLHDCIDTPRSPWNLEDHGHFTEAHPCGWNWVTYCEKMNHQDSIILNVLPYYDYTVRLTLYDYSIALEFYDKVDFAMVQMVFIMA